jgi:hypothetical protein
MLTPSGLGGLEFSSVCFHIGGFELQSKRNTNTYTRLEESSLKYNKLVAALAVYST